MISGYNTIHVHLLLDSHEISVFIQTVQMKKPYSLSYKDVIYCLEKQCFTDI